MLILPHSLTSSGRSLPHSGRPWVTRCFFLAKMFLISVMLLAFLPYKQNSNALACMVRTIPVCHTFCCSASTSAVCVCVCVSVSDYVISIAQYETIFYANIPCSSSSTSFADSAFTRFKVLDSDSSLPLHIHTHTRVNGHYI